MNGLDLYNFVYDTFVRPQYPFASRDVRHREGSSVSQEAAGEPSPCETMTERARADRGSDVVVGGEPRRTRSDSARSVIVLADHRKDKT